MFFHDEDGTMLFVTETAVQRLGYSAEELLGMTLTDLAPAAEAERYRERVERIETAGEQTFESIHLTADGRRIPVEINVTRVRFRSRPAILSVARDTSERTDILSELRDRQAHLQQAQAIANVGSWHLDLKADVLDWSHEVYRIFGIDPDTRMTYEVFLDHVHSHDRKFVNDQWAAALSGEPYHIEHRIVVDGQTKWVRERAEVEFGDDGRPSEGIGVVQDITERKNRERRIEHLTETLRTVREVNKRLVRAEDRQPTVRDIVEIIASHSAFTCTFFAMIDTGDPDFVCGIETALSEAQVRAFHTDAYVKDVFDQGILFIDDVTEPPY